ncbi:MAG: hypothetical protein NXI01_02595 [Gammaproteobacteria bacterium]|nr:hypothetical protein [Gammaproteobacteria bacterium]
MPFLMLVLECVYKNNLGKKTMGRQEKTRYLIGILVLASVFDHLVFAATATQLISNPKRGLATKKWDGNHPFTLNLAVFKNKKDAVVYQNKVTRYISAPVYVSYLSRSDRYAVVVGPIKSLDVLHTTSRQALKTSVIPVVRDKPRVILPEFRKNSWATHQKSGKNVVRTTKKHTWPLGHRNTPVEPIKRSLTTIQPGPYIGMTTGPLLNTSGAPATYSGWQGTGFAGIGGYVSQRYPWLYLGAEVYGLNSGKMSNIYPINASTVQSGWSYGFDAMPGVLINNHHMVYGRIGGIRTHFLDSQKNRFTPRDGTGWQLGAGMQSKVARHLDFRLEYIADFYDKSPAINSIGTRLYTYGNRIGFGLLYKFYDERERITK